MKNRKIAIVGAGPAGLLLARECLLRGASVSIYDGNYDDIWNKNLCCWGSELMGEEIPSEILKVISKKWSHFAISTQNDGILSFEEEYCLFEGKELQKFLQEEAFIYGLKICRENVKSIEKSSQQMIVITEDDEARYDLVVDCTGDRRRFIPTTRNRKRRYQLAIGEKLYIPEGIEHFGWTENRIEFMNFEHSLELQHKKEPLSFLYVLPLSKHEVFIEETVLVTEKFYSLFGLKLRLQKRKNLLRLETAKVLEEEICRIEMGAPLPSFAAPVLAFGAAAGCTNPITGYQIAHALQLAPKLASVLTDSYLSIDEIQKQYWQTLWPGQKRSARRIYQLCLEYLSSCSSQQVIEFFGVFFSLPKSSFLPFLQLDVTAKKQQKLMLNLFLRAKWKTKKLLVQYFYFHFRQFFTIIFDIIFDIISDIFKRENANAFTKYNHNR